MDAVPATYKEHRSLPLAERNRLVLEQLPQVRCIAQKIHARLPHHIQLEDLINTGVLGLIEALAKYDPSRKVGLQSYARYRIQGAILDSLREQDWSPRLLRQKGRQLEHARETLRARLGRTPSQGELAVELGISDDQLHHLLSDLRGLEVASLQEPTFTDGHALGETMADTFEDSPFNLCERAEMNGLLAQAMAKLTPRKREILDLYYFRGLTMKDVGTRMGVCESRISQIHSAAVASLKARMREVLLARQKRDVTVPMRPQRREPPASKGRADSAGLQLILSSAAETKGYRRALAKARPNGEGKIRRPVRASRSPRAASLGISKSAVRGA